MSEPSNNQPENAVFGEVISTYSRTQAIEDGVLVDAGPMAQEAGFRIYIIPYLFSNYSFYISK